MSAALTATLSPEQVAGVDTAALTFAGNQCDELSEAFADRTAALTEARGHGRAGWHGIAADGAQIVLLLERERLTAAAEEFRALASLLVQAGEELSGHRAEVRAVLSDAQAAGCTVRGAEVVGGPDQGAAALLTARLTAVLAAAERTDARYAAALARSAARARDGDGLGLDASRTALADAAALVGANLPAAGSSPAQVHTWWLGLDPEERRMLLADQPQLVGSLDGVPAAVRDHANRTLLAQLLADEVDRQPDPGLLSLSDRLAERRGKAPPALLLSLGLEGQGRAVLSFGDPDTADHVCVYVPGMGTRLADIGGKDADRALAIHDAAAAASPTHRPGATAAMVWLGYDAPQDLLTVTDDARAVAGAAPYDRFLRGLRATHAGPPAQLTALGHSYGSLLVGLAARRPGGTGADNVVLIGSPGTETAHASELGVAPGRVWVGAAAQDPVSSLLPGPREGALIAAGTVLSGALPPLKGPVQRLMEDRGTAWFGTNPASPSFGARLLPVDAGRGSGGIAGAHSHYLERGSSTLAAVGRIVSGRH